MTRSPHAAGSDDNRTNQPDTDRDVRGRRRAPLEIAAVTGVLSGAARAVVDWLLSQILGA